MKKKEMSVDLVQENKLLKEEVEKLRKFNESAKKLLNIYDTMEDGEYMKFLDSFVLAAERKFSKVLTNDERLALRQDMKDFIETRFTNED